MRSILPDNIEFTPEILDEATSVCNDVLQLGLFNHDTAIVDGLLAADVPEELATSYAASILIDPKVRDKLGQDPFPTGYVVGRAVVAELIN